MHSLQGFEGIFLFETRKSDRKHGVAGMRHVGGVRIRAWITTQK